jgi:TolA-binding protein
VIAQLAGAAAVGGVLVAFGLPHTRGQSQHVTAAAPRDAKAVVAAAGQVQGVPDNAVPGGGQPALRAQPEAPGAGRLADSATSRRLPGTTANEGMAPPVQGDATYVDRGARASSTMALRPSQDFAGALRVANSQVDHQLYDQALETLREAIASDRASAEAPAAYLLMASIHERRGALKDAIATYLDVAKRYPQDRRAPEALFSMADLLLKSKQEGRETQAAEIYSEIAAKYRTSPWAPRALMARAELEQRRRTSQTDLVLGKSAPAALATYREVVQSHHASPESQHALWRMANLYVDLKLYELAAENLRELATRYSSNPYDAWFTVAELYDKRLNNPAAARSAYAQVPPTSPNWTEARKRLLAQE